MIMSSILTLSVKEINQLIKTKSLNIKDLCAICLQRIEQISSLNAFITVTSEIAYQQSILSQKRYEKGNSLGILDGIPIAFKDNISTKFVKTTCGSKMLSEYSPPYNATVVQRLCDQGAIMIGKTNLDEFAMGSATLDSYFGATKNPWLSDLTYSLKSKNIDKLMPINTNKHKNDFFIAGGSSGGAAVAVATGACFGAIGSDTGGSVRNPAAHCGIVGLKPSYGRISRYGFISLCNSLDTPGIFARHVEDALIFLNCISGQDSHDSTTIPSAPLTLDENMDINSLNIGIPKEYDNSNLSEEVRNTWNLVATHFKRSGANVTYISLPHIQYSFVCYSILCYCDVSSNMARYDGLRYGYESRQEGFGQVVRERIHAGNYFLLKKNYSKYFLQAAKVRQLICEDFHKVFKTGIDLLLMPVTVSEPQLYSEWKDDKEQDDYFTIPINLAGLPAVSLPCCLSKKGLPLSLQLVGAPFQEKKLIQTALWLEKEMDFPLLYLE